MANKKAKKGKPHNKGPLGGGGPQQRKADEIKRQTARADKLWQDGNPEAALEIYFGLMEKYPREASLVFTTGLLHLELGLMQEGLELLEEADRIEPDVPQLLAALVMGYLVTDNPAHALMALRQLRSVDEEGEVFGNDERQQLKELEKLFQEEADNLKVLRVKFEQAMLQMERGELLTIRGEPEAGIPYLQQASELVPNWAAPLNNLSLYLWTAGQPNEAIQAARKVVDEINSEDFMALSNLVHHLAFANRKDEARRYMDRLLTVFEKKAPKQLKTDDSPETAMKRGEATALYYKTAESLAALESDETLYRLLKQGEELGLEYDSTFIRLLSAAAWNTGHEDEARKYRDSLDEDDQTDFDEGITAALARPRPADVPRWRMPYFDATDLAPPVVLQKIMLFDFDSDVQTLDGEEIIKAYDRYSRYYPFLASQLQILTIGKPELVGPTLIILSIIGAPDGDKVEVRQGLKDFALGVDGPEETRRTAVSALIEIEELPKEGEIRFWSEEKAEWQQLSLAEFPPFDLYHEIIETEEIEEEEEV
jgi:tetratricopeptide (TPR) repeat protein